MSIFRSRAAVVAAIAATTAAGFVAGCGDSTGGGGSASGGGDGGGKDTFTIGVANGQTGYLAPFDVPITAGVKQRAAELNESGGLGGRARIEIKLLDTRSDIGEQATKTQELIGDGVDALVLACDSDPAIAGGQVAQRAGVPAFACPSNPERVGDHLFQMFAPERAHPSVAAQYAIERGWRRGFLLGSTDTAYTQNGVDYFRTVFTRDGGEIVGSASFRLDQQDFATVVQQIKRADPQVLYTTMYEPTIATLLKQLRGAGVTVPVIGDSIESPALQDLPASVRRDVYFTSIVDTNPDAPAGRFIAAIGDRYGGDAASVYAVMGSDVVTVLDAAYRASGGDDGRLAAAIAGLSDVDGVDGAISYDWPGAGNTQLRPVLVKSLLGGDKTRVWKRVTPDPSTYPPVIG
ncbi:ABC transporter substrate-binding protein [Conexibacter sp. JD483]|uniref:ABC transporter substrate-binding protein n=1 Tax=unclassified Conexibacter TaxID=2627773 RepID=UPI00271D23D6|nr:MULTISPECIES: ABC transporter substrate-binding protein [unclassified Conexibacter]MDO8186451.1 ABC transporter substrate-binding protein [Conexibacter sp. CPCC 205706]MDO8200020.1 ABC transporter substrate-binding protein [Conexibacter sp. CPCC 205762]MDR9370573.1 ABC transporter substrate-binding protein [Conexibacter sp. JD483]